MSWRVQSQNRKTSKLKEPCNPQKNGGRKKGREMGGRKKEGIFKECKSGASAYHKCVLCPSDSLFVFGSERATRSLHSPLAPRSGRPSPLPPSSRPHTLGPPPFRPVGKTIMGSRRNNDHSFKTSTSFAQCHGHHSLFTLLASICRPHHLEPRQRSTSQCLRPCADRSVRSVIHVWTGGRHEEERRF